MIITPLEDIKETILLMQKKQTKILNTVKNVIDVPLIIGGGINTPEVAARSVRSGASIIVTGTIIENDLNLTKEFADAIHWRR